MYKSMLVALDGSPAAERAVPAAVGLAARDAAAVHFVTVHEVSDQTRLACAPAPAETRQRDRADLRWRREYVERVAGRLAGAFRLTTSGAVLRGEPVAAIARYVAEHGIELVVATSHGSGGYSPLWLGSVADRLIRRLRVPLLLCRGGPGDAAPLTAPPGSVLVPLDGSDAAEAAITPAAALVRPGGLVRLLTAIEPVRAFVPAGTWHAAESSPQQDDMRIATEYLRSMRKSAALRAAPTDVRIVASADPAGAILEAAEAPEVGAIALTKRGLAGASSNLLGGVADKVIRWTSKPVLVCDAAGRRSEPSDAHRAAARRAVRDTVLTQS